jgi:hypothetical protein
MGEDRVPEGGVWRSRDHGYLHATQDLARSSPKRSESEYTVGLTIDQALQEATGFHQTLGNPSVLSVK